LVGTGASAQFLVATINNYEGRGREGGGRRERGRKRGRKGDLDQNKTGNCCPSHSEGESKTLKFYLLRAINNFRLY
jgi:hypothetical protein